MQEIRTITSCPKTCTPITSFPIWSFVQKRLLQLGLQHQSIYSGFGPPSSLKMIQQASFIVLKPGYAKFVYFSETISAEEIKFV